MIKAKKYVPKITRRYTKCKRSVENQKRYQAAEIAYCLEPQDFYCPEELKLLEKGKVTAPPACENLPQDIRTILYRVQLPLPTSVQEKAGIMLDGGSAGALEAENPSQKKTSSLKRPNRKQVFHDKGIAAREKQLEANVSPAVLEHELNILLASQGKPRLIAAGRKSGRYPSLVWLYCAAVTLDRKQLTSAFWNREFLFFKPKGYCQKLAYILNRIQLELLITYDVDLKNPKIANTIHKLRRYNNRLMTKILQESRTHRASTAVKRTPCDNKASYNTLLSSFVNHLCSRPRGMVTSVVPHLDIDEVYLQTLTARLYFLTTMDPCSVPKNTYQEALLKEFSMYYHCPIAEEYQSTLDMLLDQALVIPVMQIGENIHCKPKLLVEFATPILPFMPASILQYDAAMDGEAPQIEDVFVLDFIPPNGAIPMNRMLEEVASESGTTWITLRLTRLGKYADIDGRQGVQAR